MEATGDGGPRLCPGLTGRVPAGRFPQSLEATGPGTLKPKTSSRFELNFTIHVQCPQRSRVAVWTLDSASIIQLRAQLCDDLTKITICLLPTTIITTTLPRGKSAAMDRNQ
ncbi:Uu.00g077300.m01.CDS01 [Anthostomella pinea]|uniref:Uu.00g077300.m01.CDS01 n=1 Tax=Anthostomella pinea TaxID=933095 RepID=A0AAI8VWY0_9PEZI|nr:Uu.00g077300.m01.CDS01 [Anthostomella pinea]